MLCSCLVLAAPPTAAAVPGHVSEVASFEVLGKSGSSALYAVHLAAADEYSSGPVQLLDLHGSRREQGEAFGVLGGKATKENYDALIGSLIDTKTPTGLLEKTALEAILDWQWSAFLSKDVAGTHLADELSGFAEGCASALPLGAHFCKHAAGRMQVLANLPGDISDVVYVLLAELHGVVLQAAATALRAAGHGGGGGDDDAVVRGFLSRVRWPLAQCSMFAAWGGRVAGGGLLSGRNLDWNHNTGINTYKLVTVYHPPEANMHAHATFGFGGLIGALAGISAAGITTHEANLESNRDTFKGFPWLLRLRRVLEGSSNLEEAQELWRNTSNTVGFNHMVASAADLAAVVIETNAVTSAYFGPNDPREANAAFPASGHSGQTGGRIIRGKPMAEAVWRSNHGFDPRIVRHYMWNATHAYNDSDYRYHLIADSLANSSAAGRKLDPASAVQLTALAGQKGPDYFTCQAPFTPHGSNVLSVMTDATNRVAYAAWEDGRGIGTGAGHWRPAACNSYIKLELNKWFARNGSSAPPPLPH
jgi:hypothetical protein